MKTKIKLILISTLFFLICLLFLFLNLSLLKKIEKSAKEILRIKSEILAFEEKQKAFDEYKKEKEKIERIERALFEKEIPLPFFSFLKELSKLLEVSIKVSLSQTKKEIFPTLYFQIYFSGNKTSVFEFLKKLENAQFFLEFQKLNISQKEKEEIEGEVLVKVLAK